MVFDDRIESEEVNIEIKSKVKLKTFVFDLSSFYAN